MYDTLLQRGDQSFDSSDRVWLSLENLSGLFNSWLDGLVALNITLDVVILKNCLRGWSDGV